MERIVQVRISQECENAIDYLIRHYPGDYKNASDVLRAGIFALKRWKRQEEA